MFEPILLEKRSKLEASVGNFNYRNQNLRYTQNWSTKTHTDIYIRWQEWTTSVVMIYEWREEKKLLYTQLKQQDVEMYISFVKILIIFRRIVKFSNEIWMAHLASELTYSALIWIVHNLISLISWLCVFRGDFLIFFTVCVLFDLFRKDGKTKAEKCECWVKGHWIMERFVLKNYFTVEFSLATICIHANIQ